MSIIEKMNWRYATKKFDDARKLTAEQLDTLLTAIQLAPSSMGLQHYRVLVIEDAAIREQLREASYGQQQITQASQLIVFAAETNIDEKFGKDYIDRIAATRGVDRSLLAAFEQSVLGTIDSRSDSDLILWAQKQAYIALGVLLTAAAELGIDACPMEGFLPGKYDEILGLKEKGLTASVIAPVGFRAADDPYSQLKKVRRSKDDLFIHI